MSPPLEKDGEENKKIFTSANLICNVEKASALIRPDFLSPRQSSDFKFKISFSEWRIYLHFICNVTIISSSREHWFVPPQLKDFNLHLNVSPWINMYVGSENVSHPKSLLLSLSLPPSYPASSFAFHSEASPGTYFTHLCSTFLNKLTKIIVNVVGGRKKSFHLRNILECLSKSMISIHQFYVCTGTKNRAPSAL